MSEELKTAQARIACLEGEIAKRDARIVELDDLVLSLQCKVIERDGELDAIKAQEPVAWAGAIEYGVPLLMVEPQNWKATPLYAAPVSEAKAQGVVMPTVDQAMRVVLREMGSSKHIRGTSNWCADVGRAVLDEVARLNAAPVKQVSVPDDEAVMAKARELFGWAYGLGGFSDAVRDLVAFAHPAAPAADAGGVLEQAMYTLISIGYHENSGLVHELRQALAAHRTQGVV